MARLVVFQSEQGDDIQIGLIDVVAVDSQMEHVQGKGAAKIGRAKSPNLNDNENLKSN